MAERLFVAVQCAQCSTMQVNQQSSKTKKWACAVCGQRQSVRRVHARGAMAADVRGFVQRFNLERGFAEEGGGGGGELEGEAAQVAAASASDAAPRRKRMDWSEYLDDDNNGGGGDINGNEDFDGVVVTTEDLRPGVRPMGPRPKSNGPTSAKRKRAEFPLGASVAEGRSIDSVPAAPWWAEFVDDAVAAPTSASEDGDEREGSVVVFPRPEAVDGSASGSGSGSGCRL